MLDKNTVESLARGLVEIIDQINAFYENPETEAAYQEWLAKRNKELMSYASVSHV